MMTLERTFTHSFFHQQLTALDISILFITSRFVLSIISNTSRFTLVNFFLMCSRSHLGVVRISKTSAVRLRGEDSEFFLEELAEKNQMQEAGRRSPDSMMGNPQEAWRAMAG
ncbi:MAG: hypothetical protein HUU32_02885 [Calditrichaceae bacterium]|nr:hypothetical protein [Calditrichia bacterium]NUQ40323.1 hypothetical protein [Calditrichaceae bacterium]